MFPEVFPEILSIPTNNFGNFTGRKGQIVSVVWSYLSIRRGDLI